MPETVIKVALLLAAAAAVGMLFVYLVRRATDSAKNKLGDGKIFFAVGKDTLSPEIIIRELSALAESYDCGGEPLKVNIVDLGLPLSERRAVMMLAEDLGNVELSDVTGLAASLTAIKKDP